MSEWVSVKSAEPQEGYWLVYAPSADEEKPLRTCAWWHAEEKRWGLIHPYWAKSITHWAEWPEDPGEDSSLLPHGIPYMIACAQEAANGSPTPEDPVGESDGKGDVRGV